MGCGHSDVNSWEGFASDAKIFPTDSNANRQDVQDISDCDEDDNKEEGVSFGYERLYNPDENVDLSIETTKKQRMSLVTDVPTPDSKQMLWYKQRLQVEHISLEQEHVDKIKEAMSGFTIPSVNIPEWAKDISEQEWRDKISTVQLNS